MVGAVIWESSQLAFVFLAACVCVCARIALPGLKVELHFGWLSKLWSAFGSLIYYGTYYLGYPKRDPNFDNYPFGNCVATPPCPRPPIDSTLTLPGAGV